MLVKSHEGIWNILQESAHKMVMIILHKITIQTRHYSAYDYIMCTTRNALLWNACLPYKWTVHVSYSMNAVICSSTDFKFVLFENPVILKRVTGETWHWLPAGSSSARAIEGLPVKLRFESFVVTGARNRWEMQSLKLQPNFRSIQLVYGSVWLRVLPTQVTAKSPNPIGQWPPTRDVIIFFDSSTQQ